MLKSDKYTLDKLKKKKKHTLGLIVTFQPIVPTVFYINP